MNIGMSGHYHITKRKAGSDEVIAEYEFDNMILNSGLNRYVSYQTDPDYGTIFDGVILAR